MKKYKVEFSPRALRDLDNIYSYISETIFAGDSADKLADEFEEAIFTLDEFPFRGPERKVGRYANKGYRQLFVENYVIVYRVDEGKQKVTVVTVCYMYSDI